MSELLPCPFCGSPAEIDPRPVEFPDWWGCTVWCSAINTHECSAQIIAAGDTEQEAIEAAVVAWNRRDGCEICRFGAKPMTEENMRELGWVRERTCKRELVELDESFYCYKCDECGYPIDNDARYCAGCGAKVVEE